MPRKRLQKVSCDCLDCREALPAEVALGTAAARQQPPPKCLLFYIPRCFKHTTEEQDGGEDASAWPHVNAAVRDGSSGLLGLRKGASDAWEDTGVLENLFCLPPVQRQPKGKGAESRGAALRDLVAELVTDCEAAGRLGWEAGFGAVHHLSSILPAEGPGASVADNVIESCTQFIADRLDLAALRQEESASTTAPAEAGRADLLFVCLDAQGSELTQHAPADLPEAGRHSIPAHHQSSSKSTPVHPTAPASFPAQPLEAGMSTGAQQPDSRRSGQEAGTGARSESSLQLSNPAALQTVDRLLQSLNMHGAFHHSVLLVLLLGLDDPSETVLPRSGGQLPRDDLGMQGFKGVLRPRQSYEFAGLDDVEIGRRHSVLSIQRLSHVIRKDKLRELPTSMANFHPGNGCILAERLLPEIAYKLGSAPKYGA